MTRTWTRLDEGNDLGYMTEGATLIDNGAGMGGSRGSGRWAVIVAGQWQANVDTLTAAKTLAEEILNG